MITATTLNEDSRWTESLSHGNDPDEVRPMEAAVRCVWGETPFYWLQYQLLMAEMQMRFEPFHCFDFEEITWKDWIEQRFKEWVGDTNETDLDDEENDETTSQAERKAKITSDPKNAEFQKCEDYASLYPFNEPFLITRISSLTSLAPTDYAAQSDGAKDALLDVISEPFEMMDDIVNNWFEDFDEPLSCYTYLSFLGQDWFFTTVRLRPYPTPEINLS